MLLSRFLEHLVGTVSHFSALGVLEILAFVVFTLKSSSRLNLVHKVNRDLLIQSNYNGHIWGSKSHGWDINKKITWLFDFFYYFV